MQPLRLRMGAMRGRIDPWIAAENSAGRQMD